MKKVNQKYPCPNYCENEKCDATTTSALGDGSICEGSGNLDSLGAYY
jgi:hypothetical protein